MGKGSKSARGSRYTWRGRRDTGKAGVGEGGYIMGRRRKWRKWRERKPDTEDNNKFSQRLYQKKVVPSCSSVYGSERSCNSDVVLRGEKPLAGFLTCRTYNYPVGQCFLTCHAELTIILLVNVF